MSSELHKYIETAIEKKQSLFNSEVLNFPNKKMKNISDNLNLKINDHWNINDNINDDQLKAVTGICFMFGVLFLIGLFANLNIY